MPGVSDLIRLPDQLPPPALQLLDALGLTSTGIVVRSQSVEVCHAWRSFEGARITSLLATPVARGRDDEVPAAISRALAEAHVSSRRAVVSIASPDILLRSFTLPSLPKPEWAAAVQFEARKHIPFRPEDLVWDFHVTEQRVMRQLEVAFVAIRAETFGRILGWMKAADVTPLAIEPQAVSLARWMMFADKSLANQHWCLVDVEPNGAHIVIAKDQVPSFTRDVVFNGPAGDPALRVREPAGAETSPAAPETSALDSRAEILMSELRLSINFFLREHPASSVGRVWMFGDEGTLSSWCPWLSKQLGAPVEMGRLPTGGLGQFSSLRFACAAGLAMRQLPASRVRINFASRLAPAAATAGASALKPKLAESPLGRILGPYMRPIVAQLVVALVFLGMLKMVTDRRVDAVRMHNDATIRAFPDVGWRLAGKAQAQLQTLQKDVDRRLAFLEGVLGQRISLAPQLDTLVRILPEGIWLEGVNYTSRSDYDRNVDHTKLVIQGACYLQNPDKELAAIREFAERLKAHETFGKDFSSTELGEIMSTSDRTTQVAYKRFRLDCGVGGVAGLGGKH